MGQIECYICKQLVSSTPRERDRAVMNCPGCGKHTVHDDDLLLYFQVCDGLADRQRAIAAGWIRQRSPIALTRDQINMLPVLPTPTVDECADTCLLAMSRIQPGRGEQIHILGDDPNTWPMAFAQDRREMDFVLKDNMLERLRYLDLVITDMTGPARYIVKITARGWDRVRELDLGSNGQGLPG